MGIVDFQEKKVSKAWLTLLCVQTSFVICIQKLYWSFEETGISKAYLDVACSLSLYSIWTTLTPNKSSLAI